MLDDAQQLMPAAAELVFAKSRYGLRFSLNLRLALRNLGRDKARFAVTLAGVTFSVVLMALQSALLIGFAQTSSSLVDHSTADFWLMPQGTRNVDQASEIGEWNRYRALAIPGVAAATKMFVRFLPWKRPDGGVEVVNIVGIDPGAPAVVPWNIVAGSLESLKWPDGVIIDTLYAEKLGVTRIGQTVEINGHRARVAGLTAGIRAFTQSPYVFTAFDTALAMAGTAADRASYILITARPDADRTRLRLALEAQFPDYDVMSSSAFSWRTEAYWLFTTGAGVALIVAAILGLVVGTVIVGQTLYAATVERLREYATLRAIGAEHSYLRSILLKQASISAILGYFIGMVVTVAIASLSRNSTVSILMPWELFLGLLAVTLAMCSFGALISVRKLVTLDPAIVFA